MPDFVDSHAHIYLKDFKEDIQSVMDESRDTGINKIFMPNIDHLSIEDMLHLELKFPENCFPMMGLHPCSVKKDFESALYEVESWLSKRNFLAIGEMGIDLYWDKTYFEEQKEAFKIQAEMARKYDLPMVIHCRDSFEETITLLEALNNKDLKGVFHCFTGTLSDAERVIKQGFFVGLGGVSTFKNSGMSEVIPSIDLDYVILETDSPYLAPAPHRGKRNKPSYIPIIANKIAEFKKMNVDEIARITTINALKLFKK